MDSFIGLIGALTCTPLMLLFPAAFHLRAYQKADKDEKRKRENQRNSEHFDRQMTNVDLMQGADVDEHISAEMNAEEDDKSIHTPLTTKEVWADIGIITASAVVTVICTYHGIQNWK